MVTTVEYDAYKAKNLELVRSTIDGMGCRPVLFVGSGLTKRYLGGPDWLTLLREVAKRAGVTDDHFNFLAQKGDNNPIQIGSLVSEEVHAWAFSAGRNRFPADYFEAGIGKDAFIKFLACEIMNELLPNLDHLEGDLKDEVDALRVIGPHAIITTNFDEFLEVCFPDYELVVGERIIPFSLNITGELYKIHGTSSDPQSIVLTSPDYVRFMKKRRYISSKMMTYFAEFPVFIFGYGLNDDNVNSIISDLGEALKDKGGLLENVFLVKRIQDLSTLQNLQEEHAIAVGDGTAPPLRVRTILTADFKWLFDALGDTANPLPIPVKTLRHLAARVVELVRVDVPRSKIEIDFAHVERLSENPEELAQVLGISNVQNANIQYPYSPTKLGRKLGYTSWHKANNLIEILNDRLGFDIKSSDNDYHWLAKVGDKTEFHKYSERLVDCLVEIRDELKG